LKPGEHRDLLTNGRLPGVGIAKGSSADPTRSLVE
jgi:hypothetical protein